MENTSPKSGFFGRGYQLWRAVVSRLQSPLLLVLRLYWGWQFFLTGKGKLLHLDKTAAFFSDLHIPCPHLNAGLSGATECFGGLFLLLGLFSRLVTVPMIFTMVIAYATAESAALKSIWSDPDKFVSAAPFLFLLACVIVLVFGPGIFSADWLILKNERQKS
ncbi:MAG: DoxX family protein [Limisphaerales bacterium]